MPPPLAAYHQNQKGWTPTAPYTPRRPPRITLVAPALPLYHVGMDWLGIIKLIVAALTAIVAATHQKKDS